MDMAISEPLGQMDDIQAWPNRFTIIALILDFAAFLRASHCGVTFLRVHIFILNSFFPSFSHALGFEIFYFRVPLYRRTCAFLL